jgi:hypothetical protein
MSFLMLLSVTFYSKANEIQSSKIYTGTYNLLNDASTTLMKVAIPVGIAVVVYCFIRKGAADDMDQKKWKNRIIIANVCTVGAILGGVILKLIVGYYN